MGSDQSRGKLEVVDLTKDVTTLIKGKVNTTLALESVENTGKTAIILKSGSQEIARLENKESSAHTNLYTSETLDISTDSGKQRKVFISGENDSPTLSTDLIIRKSGSAGGNLSTNETIGKVQFSGKVLDSFKTINEIISRQTHDTEYDGILSFVNSDQGVLTEYLKLEMNRLDTNKKVSIGAPASVHKLAVSDNSTENQALFGETRTTGKSSISIGTDANETHKALRLCFDNDTQKGSIGLNSGASGMTITHENKIGFNTDNPTETYDFAQGNIKHKGSFITTVVALLVSSNSTTWDCNEGSMADIDYGGSTGDVIITMTNVKKGATYQLHSYQNGGAPRSITLVAVGFTFISPGGIIELTQSLGACDVITFSVLTNDGIYAIVSKGFQAVS